MNKPLQLLTATGARPFAWELCERWMARQDFDGPVTWVIVDDGQEPQKITKHPKGWLQVVIRPFPAWRPGMNTQARNLLKGLEALDRSVPTVFIEDDDWYAPNWLTRVALELEHADVVGEGFARYYNVATRRFRQLHNARHASLCSTAIKGAAYSAFDRACYKAPKFIDLELWRSHHSTRVFGGHSVVGLKGLPGRTGIGMGHAKEFGHSDRSGAILREWIGEDAGAFDECCKPR